MHRIDWFTDNTDPRLVSFEPDTMHTLAGRARFPDPVDGSLFDINALVRRAWPRQRRLIAWHIKDADRIPLPRRGHEPVHAGARAAAASRSTAASTSSTSARGRSARATRVDIDPEVLGFPETFTRFRLSDPGWFNTESDLGPGPATDPGRSLRWAKVSAAVHARVARGPGWRGL